MVYLCSYAKDFLQNTFFLHQYTGNYIGEKKKYCFQYFWMFEAVMESTLECCRAVLSLPFEWPECQHSDGLSMLVSVIGMRKSLKLTNLKNMVHVAV